MTTFKTAKPGEYYVCQDWDHTRRFQVRLELDNGEMAGRKSMQISGGLSKEKADFVSIACNSHAALLEALKKAESFLDRDGKIAWHVKANLITEIRIAIAKAKGKE